MGTPQGFFDGENQDAMCLVQDCIRGSLNPEDARVKPPYAGDAEDVTTTIFLALADAGLVVVKKAEWDKANAVVSAIKALV